MTETSDTNAPDAPSGVEETTETPSGAALSERVRFGIDPEPAPPIEIAFRIDA